MKKIIILLSIVVLIMVQLIPIVNVNAEELIITTYGENNQGINPNLVTNTATLTVSNVYKDDKFLAYKIIDVFYNEITNEMTYDFTSEFRFFLDQDENYDKEFTVENYFELTSDTVNGGASSSVVTSSTLNVLVSKYEIYVWSNSIESDALFKTVGNEAGTEVVAGAYLVLPSVVNNQNNHFVERDLGKSNRLEVGLNMYGVMVANVVFEEANGNWYLLQPKIVAKKSSKWFFFYDFWLFYWRI